MTTPLVVSRRLTQASPLRSHRSSRTVLDAGIGALRVRIMSPWPALGDQRKRLAVTAQIACSAAQLAVTGTVPLPPRYGYKPPSDAGGRDAAGRC
jgi:hypothetical protein